MVNKLFRNVKIRDLTLRLLCLRPIIKGRVMCVCWAGSQFNCNPKAIALALSKQKEFQIWFAFVNPKLFTKDIPNGINAVEIGSLEYYKLLTTSQFILSNIRFAGGYYCPFKKRKGQYYIQTMHG